MDEINLDFLKTPPKQSYQAGRSNRPCVKNEINLHFGKKKHGSKSFDLAQSIAKVDELVQKIDGLNNQNNELQQQLKDFQVTAQQVQLLYKKEKQDHNLVKQNLEKLQSEYNNVDADLTNKSLVIDQMKARLSEYDGLPINFNNLVVKYVKIMNKLEGEDILRYSPDKDLVERLREYCASMKLKIPHLNSPRKSRTRAKKKKTQERFVQCDLVEETSLNTPHCLTCTKTPTMNDQSTQYSTMKRDQASQYISTMITRQTNTEKIIQKHVQTMFPETPAIDDILNVYSTWSNIRSVSPLLESPSRECCTSSKVLLKKLSTTGTCTMLCNIRRKIDYLPPNNSSNIKQEIFTPSASPTPSSNPITTNRARETSLSNNATSNISHSSILNLLNTTSGTNSDLGQLSSNAFNELWQIFGKMLLSLLQTSNAGIANTIQANSVLNQQQFLDWLIEIYISAQHQQNTASVETQTLEQSDCNGSSSPLCFNDTSVSSWNIVRPQAQRNLPAKTNVTENESNETLSRNSNDNHNSTSPKHTTIYTSNDPLEMNSQDFNSMDREVQEIQITSNRLLVPTTNICESSLHKTNTLEQSEKSSNKLKSKHKILAQIQELIPEIHLNKKKLKDLKRLLKKNCHRKKSFETRKINKNSKNIEKQSAIVNLPDENNPENTIETAVDFLTTFSIVQERTAPLEEHFSETEKIFLELISNETVANDVPDIKNEEFTFVKPSSSLPLAKPTTKRKKCKQIDNKYQLLFGDSESEFEELDMEMGNSKLNLKPVIKTSVNLSNAFKQYNENECIENVEEKKEQKWDKETDKLSPANTTFHKILIDAPEQQSTLPIIPTPIFENFLNHPSLETLSFSDVQSPILRDLECRYQQNLQRFKNVKNINTDSSYVESNNSIYTNIEDCLENDLEISSDDLSIQEDDDEILQTEGIFNKETVNIDELKVFNDINDTIDKDKRKLKNKNEPDNEKFIKFLPNLNDETRLDALDIVLSPSLMYPSDFEKDLELSSDNESFLSETHSNEDHRNNTESPEKENLKDVQKYIKYEDSNSVIELEDVRNSLVSLKQLNISTKSFSNLELNQETENKLDNAKKTLNYVETNLSIESESLNSSFTLRTEKNERNVNKSKDDLKSIQHFRTKAKDESADEATDKSPEKEENRLNASKSNSSVESKDFSFRKESNKREDNKLKSYQENTITLKTNLTLNKQLNSPKNHLESNQLNVFKFNNSKEHFEACKAISLYECEGKITPTNNPQIIKSFENLKDKKYFEDNDKKEPRSSNHLQETKKEMKVQKFPITVINQSYSAQENYLSQSNNKKSSLCWSVKTVSDSSVNDETVKSNMITKESGNKTYNESGNNTAEIFKKKISSLSTIKLLEVPKSSITDLNPSQSAQNNSLNQTYNEKSSLCCSIITVSESSTNDKTLNSEMIAKKSKCNKTYNESGNNTDEMSTRGISALSSLKLLGLNDAYIPTNRSYESITDEKINSEEIGQVLKPNSDTNSSCKGFVKEFLANSDLVAATQRTSDLTNPDIQEYSNIVTENNFHILKFQRVFKTPNKTDSKNIAIGLGIRNIESDESRKDNGLQLSLNLDANSQTIPKDIDFYFNKPTDIEEESDFNDSLSMENELMIDEEPIVTSSNILEKKQFNSTNIVTETTENLNECADTSNISTLLNSTLYNEVLTESLNPIVDNLLKEELVETSLTLQIKPKRGRKRKSECLTEVQPCKRSQRLKAKQIILEESLNICKTPVELGKYNKNRTSVNNIQLKSPSREGLKNELKCELEEKGKLIENKNTIKMCFFRERLIGEIENGNEEASMKTSTLQFGYEADAVNDTHFKVASKINQCDLNKQKHQTLFSLECEQKQYKPFKHKDSNEHNDKELNLLTPDCKQQVEQPFYPKDWKSDRAVENLIFTDPPKSPEPLENTDDHISETVVIIPAERPTQFLPKQNNPTLFDVLIDSYKGENQKQVLETLTGKERQRQEDIFRQFKHHLISYCYCEMELDPKCTSLRLINKLLNISPDFDLIKKAIITVAQNAKGPNVTESDLPSIIQEMPPRHLSKCLQRLFDVLKNVITNDRNFCQDLVNKIESELFNIKQVQELSLQATLNLTQLYLMACKVQENINIPKHQARMFIAKCLYFYIKKSVLMIHEVLMWYPTVLPYREDKTYDRSDALIMVIQQILMSTKYEMDKPDLRGKSLLSKLRYEYHFEPFKPTQEEVIHFLVEKLKNSKFSNISLAFCLICKRMFVAKIQGLVLKQHLLPLINEFYSLALKTNEYDKRIAVLLEIISMLIKPFPKETDIQQYFNEFARFLNGFKRQLIQEAALCSILRLQRFNMEYCYNLLRHFQPTYNLNTHTQVMLKTFLYRRPVTFWKNLKSQNPIGFN